MTGCVDHGTEQQKDYENNKTTGEGVDKNMSDNPLMGHTI